MRHDDDCDYNAPPGECGCAERAAKRRREQHDAAMAYRFIMLGGKTSRETYPYPVVKRPITIRLGEKYGLTEAGEFIIPRPRSTS